jgi:hypothetical protein
LNTVGIRRLMKRMFKSRWILFSIFLFFVLCFFNFKYLVPTKSIFLFNYNFLFWFDLPLGILLAVIFHNFVRDSLINNLPPFLKSRYTVFNHFDWNSHFKRNWFIVTISILIGATSHILWDSFTHEQSYFVQNISALQKSVVFCLNYKWRLLFWFCSMCSISVNNSF